MSNSKEKRRGLRGIVLSNKMDKTVVVLISRKVQHPVYKKYITRSTKLHAHDKDNSCQEGDTVLLAATRPISKTKSWEVLEILERAE